jgi:dephospho-CoA kinase
MQPQREMNPGTCRFRGWRDATVYTALGHAAIHTITDVGSPGHARTPMLRVGLTGGVACGKSTIGKMLEAHGAHFLQADTLAHQLYEPSEPTYEALVKHFGRGVLNPDGTISRPRLANVVFPNRTAELNAIVHPAVIAAQNRWMAEVERADPGAVAVVEAALLIEAGAAKDFDKVIVVTCELSQKITRYAQRAKISLDEARAEVLRRSAAQLSDDEKAAHADYLIDNSSALEDTAFYVGVLWMRLSEFATQTGDPHPRGRPRVQ